MNPDEMRMIRTLIDQETNRIADEVDKLCGLMMLDENVHITVREMKALLGSLAGAIRKKP